MIRAITIALLFAAADDPDPASKDLAAKSFAEGEAAFARRQFTAAALAFERAGRLVPHPSTWLNAAEAWERAGDLVRAAEGCDRVIELAEVGARFVAEAKKRLARIEPKIARIDVLGSPEHRVRIDGSEARRAPFSKRVLPGSHRIAWTGADGEHAIEIDLGRGESQAISLDPEDGEEEPADPSSAGRTDGEGEPAGDGPAREALEGVVLEPLEDPATSTRALELDAHPGAGLGLTPPPAESWVAFSAAGVAFGVGLTFGALTIAAKNDFDAGPTAERADTFFDRRRTANIAFLATAAAAAAGVGLWILDDLAL